jgi:hypothetical protein
MRFAADAKQHCEPRFIVLITNGNWIKTETAGGEVSTVCGSGRVEFDRGNTFKENAEG